MYRYRYIIKSQTISEEADLSLWPAWETEGDRGSNEGVIDERVIQQKSGMNSNLTRGTPVRATLNAHPLIHSGIYPLATYPFQRAYKGFH